MLHADPSGDWGTVLLALDAELVLRSKSGSRTVKARDFFSGPFSTALQPDEILTRSAYPRRKRATGGTYLKLERKVGDFATVAVAVQSSWRRHGRVGGHRPDAVGPHNIKATAAEAALAGAPTDAVIAEAAAAGGGGGRAEGRPSG